MNAVRALVSIPQIAAVVYLKHTRVSFITCTTRNSRCDGMTTDPSVERRFEVCTFLWKMKMNLFLYCVHLPNGTLGTKAARTQSFVPKRHQKFRITKLIAFIFFHFRIFFMWLRSKEPGYFVFAFIFLAISMLFVCVCVSVCLCVMPNAFRVILLRAMFVLCTHLCDDNF